MLNEKIELNGHFKIESFDVNGNLIDNYEDKNLVVISARNYMAKLIAGQSVTAIGITRFVLGSDGYKDNVMTPLGIRDTFTKNSVTETFNENRNNLISEQLNDYWYKVDFAPQDANGNATNISGIGNGDATPSTTPVVNVNATGTVLTYVFTIPTTVANGTANSAAFTEAGLFFTLDGSGYNLFAMKTFPVKAKDLSVEHKITWTIYF